MHFCPFCATLLSLERSTTFRYACATCRYVYPIHGVHRHDVVVPQSKFASGAMTADDLTDSVAMQGQPTTEARCANVDCPGMQAFYVQMQIRSADEPPTTFYECTRCKTRWRTD